MKIPAGVAALNQGIRELERKQAMINPLNIANACRHHMLKKVGVVQATLPIVVDNSASFYITDIHGGMLLVTVGQYKEPIK